MDKLQKLLDIEDIKNYHKILLEKHLYLETIVQLY